MLGCDARFLPIWLSCSLGHDECFTPSLSYCSLGMTNASCSLRTYCTPGCDGHVRPSLESFASSDETNAWFPFRMNSRAGSNSLLLFQYRTNYSVAVAEVFPPSPCDVGWRLCNSAFSSGDLGSLINSFRRYVLLGGVWVTLPFLVEILAVS